MELYVAKSYQELPVVEEPYKKGGKTYCKVRTPKVFSKKCESIVRRNMKNYILRQLLNGSHSESC